MTLVLPLSLLAQTEPAQLITMFFAFLSLPLGAVLIWLLIKLVHRYQTIRHLRSVVDDLATGNIERRTHYDIKGDLGDLARSINTLASTLREQRSQTDDLVNRLNAHTTCTDDMIIATDAQDRIIMLNPAAAKTFHNVAPNAIGRPLAEVFPVPELLVLHRAAYHSATPVSKEIRVNSPARALICNVNAVSVYTGPQYRGTLLLMRDLTDIIQAAQMKTDFVANASHELRTPLASIRAAVETLRDDEDETGTGLLDDPETTKRCLDIISGHVLRLQLLVQDLLDLSRTEDPRAVVRMDRVSLQSICDMVTAMYAEPAAEKKVDLRTQLAPDAQSVRGDERLLMLTLKNLVDNAVKFTAAGGSVTIRSHWLRTDSGLIPTPPASAVTSAASQNSAGNIVAYIMLEVRDTGCGIPPEDQQRVFERFYTVNRSRGGADRGTGLGLAIVKHAVSAMHGMVALESTQGQGTTIRCFFPIRQAERDLVEQH